jgi:hypothetical protein
MCDPMFLSVRELHLISQLVLLPPRQVITDGSHPIVSRGRQQRIRNLQAKQPGAQLQ